MKLGSFDQLKSECCKNCRKLRKPNPSFDDPLDFYIARVAAIIVHHQTKVQRIILDHLYPKTFQFKTGRLFLTMSSRIYQSKSNTSEMLTDKKQNGVLKFITSLLLFASIGPRQTCKRRQTSST